MPEALEAPLLVAAETEAAVDPATGKLFVLVTLTTPVGKVSCLILDEDVQSLSRMMLDSLEKGRLKSKGMFN